MPLLGTSDDITSYPRLVHSKAMYYGLRLHAHSTAQTSQYLSQETIHLCTSIH